MQAQGLRLRWQQAYTVNGQTRYDGIWNPGTHTSNVIWGWTIADFKAKEQQLKLQKQRLVHLESYLLPDGQIRVNAIWNPGAQQQTWIQGWAGTDFDAKADELHKKGYRIAHLNAWNLPDGQVRYDAVWNAGTHAQYYIRNATAAAFQKKYGEMWAQNFKLLLLDAHRAGGEIRYAAVWNPDPRPQYVVWTRTREQVRADYDEMWAQGLKLTSMSVVRL
jgi:hypothetical protein